MNCTNCGAALGNNTSFCPCCGTPVTQQQYPQPQYNQSQYEQPQYNQPQYTQPQYTQPQYTQPQYTQPQYEQPQYTQPQYNQPQYSAPATPAVGMAWFKFLIYFALWAGAIANLISGISLLTGSIYGGETEKALVYAFFEGLEGLDMTIGALLIALAVVSIYARFRLAGFYANGPKALNAVYILCLITNVAYIVGLATILPTETFDVIDTTSFISSSCVSLAMMVINIKYFANRKAMFNK